MYTKGFTLIELIVIITILSTIAVVVIPIYRGPKFMLHAEADRFVNSILYSQNIAVLKNTQSVLQVPSNITDPMEYQGYYYTDSSNTTAHIEITPINANITMLCSTSNLKFSAFSGAPDELIPSTYNCSLSNLEGAVNISINSSGVINVS